jgi:hypothetical protein
MEHGVARAAKLHALITAGKKARAPEPRKQALVRHTITGERIQHHEGRQIFVLGS